MVIVIMLNILIAQMSYTYSEAKRTAKLQYAVDTMLITARLEYSRFARWVSMVLKTLGSLLNSCRKHQTTQTKHKVQKDRRKLSTSC